MLWEKWGFFSPRRSCPRVLQILHGLLCNNKNVKSSRSPGPSCKFRPDVCTVQLINTWRQVSLTILKMEDRKTDYTGVPIESVLD